MPPLLVMLVGALLAVFALTPGAVVFFIGYLWLAFTTLEVALAVFVLLASVPLGLTLHHHHVYYSDLMAVVMALALLWKYRDAGLRQLAGRIFPRAFALPILALLVFAVLSLVHAESRTGAAVKILELVEFLVVIVAVIADMGMNPKSWRLLISALFLSGALMAIYGIYQFTAGDGPVSFVVYTDHVRAAGTFGQPNVFGAFMDQLFPMGVALLVLAPLGRARGWLTAAVILIGAGVWVSFSRGSWVADIAAIALMGLFVWFTRREVLRGYLGYGVALPVLLFGAVTLLSKVHVAPALAAANSKHYSVAGRLASITQGAGSYDNQQRLLIWRSALTALRQHLLTGVGMGEFHDWIATRMPKGLVGIPPQASNIYLEIGADTGIFGLLSIVWLQIAWFTHAVKAVLGKLGALDAWFYALAVGALGTFTAFTVHNLVDYMIDHGVIIPLLVAMGLMAVLVRHQAAPAPRDGASPSA